ncbi:hypothetical protein, partial [Pseudomonas viridiflava]|uniref:hypothetical protein n=1 Tax=Pseudomonas viridiflava TaxID=33069 RepID=UPI001982014A
VWRCIAANDAFADKSASHVEMHSKGRSGLFHEDVVADTEDASFEILPSRTSPHPTLRMHSKGRSGLVHEDVGADAEDASLEILPS